MELINVLAGEVYQALQDADPPFDESSAIARLSENQYLPETDINKIFFGGQPTSKGAPKEGGNDTDMIIENHKSNTNTNRPSPSQDPSTTGRRFAKRPRLHGPQGTVAINSSTMPIVIHDEEDAINNRSAHFPPLPAPAGEASSPLLSPRSMDSVSDPVDTPHKAIGVALKNRPPPTNSLPNDNVSSKRRMSRIPHSRQASITAYTKPVDIPVSPLCVIPCNASGTQAVQTWHTSPNQHLGTSRPSSLPSSPPGVTGPKECWGPHGVYQEKKGQNGLSIDTRSQLTSERLYFDGGDDSSGVHSPMISGMETNATETQSRIDVVQHEKMDDDADVVIMTCELEQKPHKRDSRKQHQRFSREATSKRVTRSVEVDAVEDNGSSEGVQDKRYKLPQLPQEPIPSNITQVPASPSPASLSPKGENSWQLEEIVDPQLDFPVRKHDGNSRIICSWPDDLSSPAAKEVEFEEGIKVEMEARQISPPFPTTKQSPWNQTSRMAEKEGVLLERKKSSRRSSGRRQRKHMAYIVAEQDGTGGEQELEHVRQTRQRQQRLH